MNLETSRKLIIVWMCIKYLCLTICETSRNIHGLITTTTHGYEDRFAEYILLHNYQSWNASDHACKTVFSGHLYTPNCADVDEDVKEHLVPGESYWLGAHEYYTAWKWTDSSRLYTYVGYLRTNLTENVEDYVSEWNDVYTADRWCESEFVGLKGNAYICLVNFDQRLLSTPDFREDRCRGSYDDYCGDVFGWSVYETSAAGSSDDLSTQWTLTTHALCAAVGMSYSSSDLQVSLVSGCALKQRYLCERSPNVYMQDCISDVCLSKNQMTWYQANQLCTLLKLTSQRMTSIKSLIGRSGRNYTYWVGLSRDRELRWENGVSVLNATRLANDKTRACLNVYVLHFGRIRFEASSCSWPQAAICEADKNSKATATTISSSPNTLLTNVTATDNKLIALDHQQNEHSIDVVAATVPVTVLIMVLAVGVFLICYMKRKKQLVFVIQKLTSFRNQKETTEPDPDTRSIDSGLCYESNDDSSFSSNYDITNPNYVITYHSPGIYQNTEIAETATSGNEVSVQIKSSVRKSEAKPGSCAVDEDGAFGIDGGDSKTTRVTSTGQECLPHDSIYNVIVPWSRRTHRLNLSEDPSPDKKEHVVYKQGHDEQGYEVPVPTRRQPVDSRKPMQDARDQIYSEIKEIKIETDDELYEIPNVRLYTGDNNILSTKHTDYVTKQSSSSDHVTEQACPSNVIEQITPDNHVTVGGEDVSDVEYWTVDDVEDFKKTVEEELPTIISLSDVSESFHIEQNSVYFVLEESTMIEGSYASKENHTVTCESSTVADSVV